MIPVVKLIISSDHDSPSKADLMINARDILKFILLATKSIRSINF